METNNCFHHCGNHRYRCNYRSYHQPEGQIAVRIQSILLGRFNQAEIDGTGFGSAGRIREQEILP